MPRRGIVAFVDARRDDEEVLDRPPRGRHLDDSRGRIHSEVLLQIDVAVLSKRRDQRAGFRVQGIDPVFHKVKDPLAFAPLPISDTAIAQPDDVAVVVFGGIEGPQLAAGRRIQCATAFKLGVVTYITPFTTIGLTCIVDR